jgi:hypothetical protein
VLLDDDEEEEEEENFRSLRLNKFTESMATLSGFDINYHPPFDESHHHSKRVSHAGCQQRFGVHCEACYLKRINTVKPRTRNT